MVNSPAFNLVVMSLGGALMLYTGTTIPGPEALATFHLLFGGLFVGIAVEKALRGLKKRNARRYRARR